MRNGERHSEKRERETERKCVCVCVCVWERERERERKKMTYCCVESKEWANDKRKKIEIRIRKKDRQREEIKRE